MPAQRPTVLNLPDGSASSAPPFSGGIASLGHPFLRLTTLCETKLDSKVVDVTYHNLQVPGAPSVRFNHFFPISETTCSAGRRRTDRGPSRRRAVASP